MIIFDVPNQDNNMNKKQYDMMSSGGDWNTNVGGMLYTKEGSSEEIVMDITPDKKKGPFQQLTVWHWIGILMDIVITVCGAVDNNWALVMLGIYMASSDLRYHLQQWDIKQLQDKIKSLENGKEEVSNM